MVIPLFWVLVGALLGSGLLWLGLRSRSATLRARLSFASDGLEAARAELASQQEANIQLREQIAGLRKTLEHQSSASQEKLEVLDRATAQLRDAFSSLAAEALRSNNRSFLELAKTSLERFQSRSAEWTKRSSKSKRSAGRPTQP
jgi:DNA recombination protein RmuC